MQINYAYILNQCSAAVYAVGHGLQIFVLIGAGVCNAYCADAALRPAKRLTSFMENGS